MSVIKNYFFSLSIQIMNILTPLITLPLVVKALGNSGMGKIAIASSILSYFMILGSTGITSFGNKFIASTDDNLDLITKFSRVFNLQLIYTSISLFLFVLYVFFLGFNLKTILFISILQLISSFIDFTWFFYGINEIKAVAIRNIIIKIIGIILIYLFVKKSEDIYNYFWIQGASTFIANLTTIGVLKRKINLKKLFFNLRINKSDFKSSFIILLPMFIMAIYSNIDRFIILGYLKNFEIVGVYDIGIKIISIFAILIISLRPIMISKVSSIISDYSRIEYLVSKSISIVFYISIPVIILLYTNIESFITLFLGEKFRDSSMIIKILSIQILFTGIGDVMVNQILISIGKENKVLKIITVLCLMLILVYIWLIPIYGIVGASIGSVVSHFIILFLEFYYVNKFVSIKLDLIEIFKSFIAGFVCLIFVLTSYFIFNINSYFEIITISILGIVLYILICYLLNLKLQDSIFNSLTNNFK